MSSKTTFKCLHCNEKHLCDPRNRGRQHYCAKPECRKASKAASQRRWVGKAGERKLLPWSGKCERVRQWRMAHPGYWRKKRSGGRDALQETCLEQDAGGKQVTNARLPDALQDACLAQPALLVGLISVMTGHALQEDIAASARLFFNRGEDILRMVRGSPEIPSHENQTHSVPAAAAPRASPV